MLSPVDPKILGSLLACWPRNDSELRDRPRKAASFLILFERAGTRLLFVKKRETPGYPWSGQIGMVGGFIEGSDESDLEALSSDDLEDLSHAFLRVVAQAAAAADAMPEVDADA